MKFVKGVVTGMILGGLAGTLYMRATAPGTPDLGWVKGGWTNNPAVLCDHGHPARRRPDVTYGGLEPRQGFERDHIVPLGLGGPDILDNLQYQPYPEAYAKNDREREAEESYCVHLSPEQLEYERSRFHREYPNT